MAYLTYIYVIILGLLNLTTGSDLDRCPQGLSRSKFLKTFQGHCYQFNHYQERWHEAQSICQKNGGHLVVIRNAKTQKFIMETLASLSWRRNGVWIGANDLDREMRWEWVTGESIEYSNWAHDQPSCKIFRCREDCGILRYSDNGLWHDKPCDDGFYLYSFICQFDMTPTTTQPTTVTTTTATTTTATTTMATTTTTATATTITSKLKVVKEDLLKKEAGQFLNKVHKKTIERISSTTPSTTTTYPKFSVIVNDPGQQKQSLEHKMEGGTAIGTTVALALGILLGLMVGVCCAAVFFVRRRRQKQKEDVSVSYNNPFYGEVTRPLRDDEGAEVAEPRDDNEQTCMMEYKEECQVPVVYDTPPSLSLNNPTYGAVVSVTSDDVNDGQYDMPKPTPCTHSNDTDNYYENSHPVEENLYEDIETIKAAIAIESLQMCKDAEDRYVSMPTKIVE